MSTLKKSVLFTAVLAGFVAAAAGQPVQSHPLSEIFPVDENLNMQGNSITNSSQIELDEGTEPEGLLLDDLTITHEGRFNKLVLDYQNNEWRVENTNINMNGNNLTGYFGNFCPSGEFVVDVRNSGEFGCVDAATAVQGTYVNRNGDTMTGTLDMQGNGILGLGRMETNGNGAYLTDSSGNYNITRIEENGNVVLPRAGLDVAAGDIDGVRTMRLVDTSNNDQYTLTYDGGNSRLALSNAGEDVIRIDDSTNNLILPGGGLDMRGSNIVNFFDAQCAQGSVIARVNSDGTYTCVDVTDEVLNDFVSRSGDTMTGTLNMQSNSIETPKVTHSSRMCIGDQC